MAPIIPFPGTEEAQTADAGFRTSPGLALRLATTPWQRLRGLTACKEWRGVLVLSPCSDVHTCGMRCPIDIAFADADGVILAQYREVGPWQRRRCRGATMTLERWADANAPWFSEGMTVCLRGWKGEDER